MPNPIRVHLILRTGLSRTSDFFPSSVILERSVDQYNGDYKAEQKKLPRYVVIMIPVSVDGDGLRKFIFDLVSSPKPGYVLHLIVCSYVLSVYIFSFLSVGFVHRLHEHHLAQRMADPTPEDVAATRPGYEGTSRDRAGRGVW
jgi:hypothetical protein